MRVKEDSEQAGFGFSISHVQIWDLNHKKRLRAKEFMLLKVVLEKTLESPLESKSILKKIIPEYSLEGLMLKLKVQYFGHVMQRADSLEKTLTVRKIEDRRRRVWLSLRWLEGITNSKDMSLSKLQEIVKVRKPGRLQSVELTKSGTWLSDWTTKMMVGMQC